MFHLDVSKVDQGVAHIVMAPIAGRQRPAVELRLLTRAFLARRASPSPLLSSPFPSLQLAMAQWVTLPDEAMSARTPAEVLAQVVRWLCDARVVTAGPRHLLAMHRKQSSRGRPDTGVHPDVRALVMPIYLQCNGIVFRSQRTRS
jgi:hypothetical protein